MFLISYLQHESKGYNIHKYAALQLKYIIGFKTNNSCFIWYYICKFSTYPDPKNSKTKYIYMCWKMNNVLYQASLQLYGVELTSAVHRGHQLHQVGTMEHVPKVRRAIFNENCTDIREMFEFVHPTQFLHAVNVY